MLGRGECLLHATGTMWYREGGIFVRGLFRQGGKFCGAKIAPPVEIPKHPTDTHTLTCKPMLRSKSERFANQSQSSIRSQHLKESAVRNTCPKLSTHGMQCHWHVHCPADTPKSRQEEISPPSSKTNFSHEIIPTRSVPSPCKGNAQERRLVRQNAPTTQNVLTPYSRQKTDHSPGSSCTARWGIVLLYLVSRGDVMPSARSNTAKIFLQPQTP